MTRRKQNSFHAKWARPEKEVSCHAPSNERKGVDKVAHEINWLSERNDEVEMFSKFDNK